MPPASRTPPSRSTPLERPPSAQSARLRGQACANGCCWRSIAWIPLALLIGYGGAAATGCDQFAAGCPNWYASLQTVLIALVLGALVALPRVAYVGAIASLATLATSIVLVAVFAVGRIQPPLPPDMAIGGFVVLVVVYVVTAALVSLNRSQLPWVSPG